MALQQARARQHLPNSIEYCTAESLTTYMLVLLMLSQPSTAQTRTTKGGALPICSLTHIPTQHDVFSQRHRSVAMRDSSSTCSEALPRLRGMYDDSATYDDSQPSLVTAAAASRAASGGVIAACPVTMPAPRTIQ